MLQALVVVVLQGEGGLGLTKIPEKKGQTGDSKSQGGRRILR